MYQTINKVPLSRLYLYANCRCIDNTPLNQDDGTTVRTACQAITNYGICLETGYPYNTENYVNLPPLNAYQGAKRFKQFTYTFIQQNLTSIKNCLNAYKVPIICGINIYSSFMTATVANTGMVPMPNTKKEQLEGGHCITIVGYNDTTQMFLCANSWGTSWGKNGYFYLPYNYITNTTLANDFCFTTFIY